MAKREISGLFVKRRREELDLSQHQLAELVGVTQQAIGAIESGKVRKPRFVNELARALQVSPTDLEKVLPGVIPEDVVDGDYLSQRNSSIFEAGLKLAGSVEAGAFKQVDAFPQAVSGRAPLSPDPRFRGSPQHAWHVRGDGMELAGIEDGMYVTAVPYDDFVSDFGPPRHGTIVVVEHRRAKGREREVSLKQVDRTEGDRIYLHPRSKNPSFKMLVIPFGEFGQPLNKEEMSPALGPKAGEEVEVLAIVLAAHRIFSA